MLLKALKGRKEWKADEDVVSCFDTLESGELFRGTQTTLAKCCKHYLPNQVLLPGLVNTHKLLESELIHCCYNLSLRRNTPVLATEIPDGFETKYCCLHHRSDRPNDVVFRNEIRQYRVCRHNQPDRSAGWRKLCDDLDDRARHRLHQTADHVARR